MSNITASFAGTRSLLGRQPLHKATESATTPSFDLKSHRLWISDGDILASGALFFASGLRDNHFLGESHPKRCELFSYLDACGSQESCETADPYGRSDHPYAVYFFVCIKQAVKELARSILGFSGAPPPVSPEGRELGTAAPAAAHRSTQFFTIFSSALT
jgi:hypothetical protein